MHSVIWTMAGELYNKSFYFLEYAKEFAEWIKANCEIDANSLHICDDNNNIVYQY